MQRDSFRLVMNKKPVLKQSQNEQLHRRTSEQIAHKLSSPLYMQIDSQSKGNTSWLDTPLKLTVLSVSPDLYIRKIISIGILALYIHNFWSSLRNLQSEISSNRGNPRFIVQLLNIYRRKLMIYYTELEDLQKKVVLKHLGIFDQFIKQNLEQKQYFANQSQIKAQYAGPLPSRSPSPIAFSSPQVLTEYIKFRIVVGKLLRAQVTNSEFPLFIIKIFTNKSANRANGCFNVDYQTFFNCVTQFIVNPRQYNLDSVMLQLINLTREKFQQFLSQYQGTATDNLVFSVKQFLLKLIQINYRLSSPTSFLRTLLISDKFSFLFISFCRKYSFLHMIKLYVQLLINFSTEAYHHMAIRIVENLIFLQTSICEKAGLMQLFQQEENGEWMKLWSESLLHNRFQLVSKMFLNGQLFSFLIFNRLLQYYNYESEKDFLDKLDEIDYLTTARSIGIKNPKAKDSIAKLFMNIVGDEHFIINEMFVEL